MKVKKFKIRVRASTDRVGENILKTLLAAEVGDLKSSKYDLVLTFPDLTWLAKIFSPERIRLIQMVRHQNPPSIYQLAKLLHRQTPNVQRDVYELVEFGILTLKKSKDRKTKRLSTMPCCEWDGFDIAV